MTDAPVSIDRKQQRTAVRFADIIKEDRENDPFAADDPRRITDITAW